MEEPPTAAATATATGTNVAEEGRLEVGRPAVLLVCGTLVYYHCACRESSLLSLVADVLIVLLCSLAILGILFRQMNISVPVDPLEWQISQDTANAVVACLANTVIITLYFLAALGQMASGATIAYAGLCLLCLYILVQSSEVVTRCSSQFPKRRLFSGHPGSYLTCTNFC